MKCFKSTLLEANTYFYYDEQCEDFMRITLSDMIFITKQGSYPFSRIAYRDNNNNYIGMGITDIFYFLKNNSKYDMDSFFVKSGWANYTRIDTDLIKLTFNLDGICRDNHKIIIIAGKDIETIRSNNFFNDERWCITNFRLDRNNNASVDSLRNQLTVVNPSDIEEGSEYFSIEYGKVLITKLNDEIDEDQKDMPFIEYVNSSEENECVKYEDFFRKPIYYLPFDNIKSPLNEINKGIKEQLLYPVVECKDDKYIVFWNKIDAAALYIVKIYKRINNYFYEMGEFSVERSKRFFTIENLIGLGYIFKVYAEDRNGKIISMSRGLVNGFSTHLE